MAVVNVRGAVVRGIKAGTGLGEPLNELVIGVGDGAEEDPETWPPFCGLLALFVPEFTGPVGPLEGAREAGKGEVDLGLRLRPLSEVPTASMGLKHCASGLKVLVTSRSAELSSWGSALSE